MKVLIVKMSSMGDVIHTLPALTDAGRAIPGISFDWIVEENFQEIPSWHGLVRNVFPIGFRRWRKNLFAKQTRLEWQAFKKLLQSQHYDLIIDAQGLLKSAFIAMHAKGKRAGFDFNSARESFAALLYGNKHAVDKKQHAITRVRNLFAAALNYSQPTDVPDYGVDRQQFVNPLTEKDYLVFLHGTTWPTKHWPEKYWLALTQLAAQQHFKIKLPWGNAAEKSRAERIAATCPNAEVLPKLKLQQIAGVLANAKTIVAVDTGLGHLSAALDVPTISIYGPTSAELTGTRGHSQLHLSAKFPCAPCFSRTCIVQDNQTADIQPPCFTTVPPERVLEEIKRLNNV